MPITPAYHARLRKNRSYHKIELFPEQIASAMPDGANIDEFVVCKPGMTLDEAERIGANRTELKKIFPGCDPRPVHTAEFPAVTKKDLQSFERQAFAQEFESQRIEGLVFNGEEKTELYLLDCDDIQTAKNNMNACAHRYIRSAIEGANSAAKAHYVEQIKYEQRIASLKDELTSTRNAALQVMPVEAAKVLSTLWGIVG